MSEETAQEMYKRMHAKLLEDAKTLGWITALVHPCLVGTDKMVVTQIKDAFCAGFRSGQDTRIKGGPR